MILENSTDTDIVVNTVAELLKSSSRLLNSISDSATLDAEILLLATLNSFSTSIEYNRAFLRSWPEHSLSIEELTCFNNYIQQRLSHKPIAYIIGSKEFWSLDLQVNKYTLIPRPETETLVELAIKKIPKQESWRVLDLGTGSGAIALSIAVERFDSHVIATDKSYEAIQMANSNKKSLQIKNCFFSCTNWFDGLATKSFQLIVSNPPYIQEHDPHLASLKYEPLSALVSAEQGLKDCRLIIEQAKKYLIKPGYLLLEHGYDQAEEIKSLLISNHYHEIQQIKDLSGIIRVSMAKLNSI